MSTRKDFRMVKFEVKHHNEKPVILWAEVPKKAFTEGKVKPNNYVEFGGDEKWWKILSAKRMSIFLKPNNGNKIRTATRFKES